MTVWQTLIVISTFSSTMTLLIVALAVLPQLKQGMAVLRDAILWAALVLIFAAGIYWSWQRWTGELGGEQVQPVSSQSPRSDVVH